MIGKPHFCFQEDNLIFRIDHLLKIRLLFSDVSKTCMDIVLMTEALFIDLQMPFDTVYPSSL